MKAFAAILISALAVHAAEWVNISGSVTSQVKPGYAGPTAGVVVDPASGDVAAPLPPGFTVNRVGPNYAWDPKNDIFYASTMIKPTFKYQR